LRSKLLNEIRKTYSEEDIAEVKQVAVKRSV
jgi:hypothetical protein